MRITKSNTTEQLLQFAEDYFNQKPVKCTDGELRRFKKKLDFFYELSSYKFISRQNDVFTFKNGDKTVLIKFVASKKYRDEDIIRELKVNSEVTIEVFLMDINEHSTCRTIYNPKWKIFK